MRLGRVRDPKATSGTCEEEGGFAVEPLTPQMLSAVPHVSFSIFDFAIPDIIVWPSVFLIVLLAAWIRLPGFFEPGS